MSWVCPAKDDRNGVKRILNLWNKLTLPDNGVDDIGGDHVGIEETQKALALNKSRGTASTSITLCASRSKAEI